MCGCGCKNCGSKGLGAEPTSDWFDIGIPPIVSCDPGSSFNIISDKCEIDVLEDSEGVSPYQPEESADVIIEEQGDARVLKGKKAGFNLTALHVVGGLGVIFGLYALRKGFS